jgi:transcription-repair coupling factor (superfamily II helicase)
MYCQLLENAVRAMKNLRLKTPLEVAIDLPWQAFLPRDYVPGQKLRIEVYRRLARVRKLERLDDFRQEMRDRFGPLPEPAEWLMRLAEVRLLAARWQIARLHIEPPPEKEAGYADVVLNYRGARLIGKVAARSNGQLRVVDDKRAYFRVATAEMEPEVLYGIVKGLLRPEVLQAVDAQVSA